MSINEIIISNISHYSATKNTQYQTVTSLTVHSGASYLLFSISRVYASTHIQIAILGVFNGLSSKHFTSRGHKAPYRYSKPNKRLYNLGKTYATKRVRPQVCVHINISHQTDFKTTNSRLPTKDDLLSAGITQWQPSNSICVPLKMALCLELNL